jgi:PAS domain S-box-containing protein
MVEGISIGLLKVRIEDMQILYANDAALRLLDLQDPSAIVGSRLWEIIPGLTHSPNIARLVEIVKNGERFTIKEFEHSRGWRGSLYWDIEAVELKSEEATSEILFWINDITSHITARKHYERIANEAKERATELEAIISQMAEGVIVVDSLGRIININRQAAVLLGVSAVGVEISNYTRAYNLFRVNGEPFSNDELPFIRALQRGEVLKEVEIVLRPSEGEERVLSVNAAPLLNSEDQIIGAVALFHDISDRIRYERMLEKSNERLMEVDQLKTRFISTVSHELRTPLNAITVLVQLLQRDKNEPLTSRQLDMVSRIAANSKLLTMLINDLLDYSRLASGKERITLKRFPASDLIEQAWVGLLDGDIEKGLECRKEVEDLGEVESDYTKCYQVLTNVLANAIKYTQQGDVCLKAGLQDSRFWRVEVFDTGPGIPSEDLESIFDEFRRGRNAESGKVVGTGLGLPISKKMVELMGGEIIAESTLGKGSKFIIIWPINVREFVSPEIIAGNQKVED